MTGRGERGRGSFRGGPDSFRGGPRGSRGSRRGEGATETKIDIEHYAYAKSIMVTDDKPIIIPIGFDCGPSDFLVDSLKATKNNKDKKKVRL